MKESTTSSSSQWGQLPPGEEIVISGISGTFPESLNMEEFSRNLYNKTPMTTLTGNRRWDFVHPELSTVGALLPEITKFDMAFFGLHGRQGKTMDPLTRLSIEKAYEAILDAGINPDELAGTRTGVLSATCLQETHTGSIMKKSIEPNTFGGEHAMSAMAANRITYFLKLNGPSHNVDTACSSSLTATEHAYKMIRSGLIDSAIIVSAQLTLNPKSSIQFFRLGIISKQGECRPFDEKSDGYVRAEAAAAIFVQRKKNARRCYGEIVHGKTNSDGFKPQSITYPSWEAQAVIMREFYREFGMDPKDVTYVEAHGTGTVVGDPEEIRACDEIFCPDRETPLPIGSVKSNMGHTEPTSGLCSIAKMVLAMNSGIIPPNINYVTPRPGIEALEQNRIKVVTDPTPLEGDKGLIAMNGFGFGGSNCHLLFRWNPKTKQQTTNYSDQIPRLLCVSGRIREGVTSILDDVSSRHVDHELINLYHRIFSREIRGHHYRGYSILDRTRNEIDRSPVSMPKYKPILVVVFTKFVGNCKKFVQDLENIPKLHESLEKFRSITEIDDSNRSFAIQLTLCDVILKQMGLKVQSFIGNVVLKDYVTDQTSYEMTVKRYLKIGGTESDCTSLLGENMTLERRDLVALEFGNQGCKSTNYHHLSLNGTDPLLNLLDVLGRLYNFGFDFALHELYPSVEYPVARGTPMISSLIKWDHTRDWHVFRYEQTMNSSHATDSITIDMTDDKWNYVLGHVIDGRSLFPATGYLYVAWQALTSHLGLLISDRIVVFENCRFHRATNVHKDRSTFFTVSVRSNGDFEIMESDVVVVNGNIKLSDDNDDDFDSLQSSDDKTSNEERMMKTKDIYKELRLRGYSYTGQFRKLIECDTNGNQGKIQWDENWVTFMDNMLQTTMLNKDTRSLFVPTLIKKVTINPKYHLEYAASFPEDNQIMTVSKNKATNVIRSGGIEICGPMASPIARKRPMEEPVLEKYEFVPNTCRLSSIRDVARVLVQIIVENTPTFKGKVAESIDADEDVSDREFLAPHMHRALTDLPLMQPDVSIVTKNSLDIQSDDVKIQETSLSGVNDCLAVIVTDGLNRPAVLNQAFDACVKNGYVITRQIDSTIQSPVTDVDILTSFAIDNCKESYSLLRRKRDTSLSPLATATVDITDRSNITNWLIEIQKVASSTDLNDVIVYAQNDETSGILGLVNCMRREPGGGKVRCVQIFDKQAPKFDTTSDFYRTQLDKNLAINVYKDGQWGTFRHLILEELQTVDCQHCYANTKVKGDLNSLRWFEGPLRTDHTTEVVHIYKASLNFRDVMNGSGRISSDELGNRLQLDVIMGFEFSGRTPNGDRVMGMTSCGALATLVQPDPDMLYPIPNHWSMEEGATTTVVYCTLIYALLMRTKIGRGDSILIHSGTGGVGQAAINLCTRFGLDIFITVGTSEKKDYLLANFPNLKESQIGNSRDTSFETMIMTETQGRGVDYVINSLADDKLQASVRCLARNGNFIEIGKYDLQMNNALNLFFLRNNASYHGIMLDHLFSASPEMKRQMSDMYMALIKDGTVKPINYTVFEMDQLVEAFKHMMTGKHIGKVLINVRHEENDRRIVKPATITKKAVPRYTCREDRSYVIVGGLGGFGLELADWLVLRGARHVILTSRTGITKGYQQYRVKVWRSYGVRIDINTNDITTYEGCLKLIDDCNAVAPLAAIFNLAVILADAILDNQTVESFETSLGPKADATRFLDEISRRSCPLLTNFVVFSSVSCGRGNAGQTNYGMSNSIMERICELRRQNGYPGTAIQWGAVGDVGLVADMQDEDIELAIGGTLQQRILSCLHVMDTFMRTDAAVVASMVVAKMSQRGANSDNIVYVVQDILGIKDLKTVSMQSPLSEIGMDSMTAVEIRQTLDREFQILLSPQDIRTMTFARLQELQNERSSNSEVGVVSKDSKNVDAFAMMLGHIINEADSKNIQVQLPTATPSNLSTTTVFFIPGMEGVAKTLEPLTINLERINAIALQLNQDRPKDTIEESALELLPLVEELSANNGDFKIVGYSFGALVALELAARLESKGRQGVVICIDNSPVMWRQSFKGLESDAEYETYLISHIMTFIAPYDVIVNQRDAMLNCQNLGERLNVCELIVPNDCPHSFQHLKQVIRAALAKFTAAREYQPKFILKQTEVILYKPSEVLVQGLEEDYGLSTYCQLPVKTYELSDTNHVTILENLQLAKDLDQLFGN